MSKQVRGVHRSMAGLGAAVLLVLASCAGVDGEADPERPGDQADPVDPADPAQPADPGALHAVSVAAVSNYDPARVVEFEFPEVTGTVLPIACDFCSASFDSPFPIRFGGEDPGFTTVHVISKGLISFTAPVFFGFENQPLPTAVLPTVISPFWDDLITTAPASVRFQVFGTAPDRELVIEFRDVRHFGQVGTVRFQAVFFENSTSVQFNYADVEFGVPTLDRGLSQTVGLQVAPGIAQQFSFNTDSLTNNLSLLFSQGTPIAAAGADQVVPPGEAVQLDGRASRDPDGEIVSFAWHQTAGAPAVIAGADTATPVVSTPDVSGTLTFRLDVTDDEGKVGSDSVNIIVNRAPVADPGDDFRVATNLTGTLDGTASTDPDGTVVGFRWSQIHGEPVALQNADAPIATFTAPATPGFLIFQLTVSDEHGFAASDIVVVDVFLNLAPVAAAGEDRIVRPGAAVTIDGTASHDPDGTIASYAWTVQACVTLSGTCTIALTGASTASPQFVAPSVPAIVAFQLVVTDNVGATATDTVTFGVFLQAPVAVIATPAACALGGSTIALDGSRSVDADGTIATYQWTQLSGPPVVLTSADTAVAAFAAPTTGALGFALTVTDNDGLSSTKEITLVIDQPPVARASASAAAVLAGTTVTLDGSQSLDAASFSWQQTAGTAAPLSDPTAAQPSFVAATPAAPFELVTFALTVTDSCGQVSTDDVTIVVVRP